MQEQWDKLDRIIAASRLEVEPASNYNQVLLSKINTTSCPSSRNRTVALSLSMAGILLLFVHTADLQTSLIDATYKLKTNVILWQQEWDIAQITMESDL